MKQVLCITDTPLMQTTAKQALCEHYQLLIADHAFKALELASDNNIDLFIIDIDEMCFEDIMKHILQGNAQYESAPIITLTHDANPGDNPGDNIGESLLQNRFLLNSFITKPITTRQLLKKVDALLGNNP